MTYWKHFALYLDLRDAEPFAIARADHGIVERWRPATADQPGAWVPGTGTDIDLIYGPSQLPSVARAIPASEAQRLTGGTI